MRQLQNIKVLMLLDNSFKSDARVEKEINCLIKANFQITVACVKKDGFENEELRDGYKIIRIINGLYSAPLNSKFKTYFRNTVKKILELDFDILHCHDFYMLHLGAEVKRLKPDITLIYDAHEYLKGWPFYLNNIGFFNKIKGYVVWKKLINLEKKSVPKSDYVLTVTNSIARKLKDNNNLKVLPVVLGNFPTKTTVSTVKNYFQDKYDLKKETKILVASGTIYQTDKQLENLFDIVNGLNNCALVFIGNRPRFYQVKKNLEKRTSLKKLVFFHEYLNDQQSMINLLSCADIGLMHVTTSWEAHKITFSNRFVEYISAKIPVIATPQEFTIEVNNQNRCCEFYEENDLSSLKPAILKMINNLDFYKENALKASNFSNWEKESLKLLNLYSDIIIKK